MKLRPLEVIPVPDGTSSGGTKGFPEHFCAVIVTLPLALSPRFFWPVAWTCWLAVWSWVLTTAGITPFSGSRAVALSDVVKLKLAATGVLVVVMVILACGQTARA